MAAASSSPIQSSPSTSTSPSTSSSPSSSPPPPHSPSLSPTNPNSLSTTPDPNPNMAPTVALPPPAAIALPQHPPPPPESQPSSNPPPSAPTSTRRVPPPCWSVEETVALIDGYQDKWYTLRRGNLKANHWQDVADFVTSRCANLPGSSHKTAVQCRHKVEKLRKRYRSERQRCLRNQNRTSNSRTNSSSTWFFFKKMDAMELGPISNAPNRYHTSNNGNILSGASVGGNGNRDISCGYGNAIPTSVPSRHVPPQSTSPSDASSNDSDDDSEGDVGIGNNNSTFNARNLHGLVSNGSGVKFKIPKAVRSRGGMPMLRSEGGGSMPVIYPRGSAYPSSSSNHVSVGTGGNSRFTRGVYNNTGMRPGGLSGMEEMRSKMDKKRGRDGVGRGGSGMDEIVSAVRMLGDGFMRMEQMKMDMEKEIHNMRMDMELKHTEMILDTQRQIVDTFLKYIFSREFHISLGRTVPILVHQIDSIVSMLRQKLQTQKLDWIEFNDWEVFVNDDGTRSFLSLEVTSGGLFEITKLIRSVDIVYRLHGLPEFYKNAQPHISLLWAIGDIRNTLKQAVKKVEGESCCSRKRCIFTTQFSMIECKIGKTSYKITKNSRHLTFSFIADEEKQDFFFY